MCSGQFFRPPARTLYCSITNSLLPWRLSTSEREGTLAQLLTHSRAYTVQPLQTPRPAFCLLFKKKVYRWVLRTGSGSSQFRVQRKQAYARAFLAIHPTLPFLPRSSPSLLTSPALTRARANFNNSATQGVSSFVNRPREGAGAGTKKGSR